MLCKGDRLESIQGYCDTCIDMRKLPTGTRLEFFRPRANGRLIFLCPLTCSTDYSDVPQLAANNILGDELHTGSGGVAQYAGGSNFATIIENAEHTLHVRARNQTKKTPTATRIRRAGGEGNNEWRDYWSTKAKGLQTS